MKTTVSARGSTLIPAEIRKNLGIGPNSEVEWINDGRSVRLIPVPENPIKASRGISKGMLKALLAERKKQRLAGE